YFKALRLEALADCRLLHQLRDLAAESLDDGTRRARWRIEAEVRAAVDPFEARLLHRRHVGEIAAPLRADDGEEPQLSRLGLRQPGARVEREIDLPAEERSEERRV